MSQTYHIMIDDKFIDEFIDESEKIIQNQNYFIFGNGNWKYVKSKQVKPIVLNEENIQTIASVIKIEDKVFVHWFSPHVNRIINSIPKKTKVYLMFWGGDFLESNLATTEKNPLNKRLYAPLTLTYVKQAIIAQAKKANKTRYLEAKRSGNLKNILHTTLKNISNLRKLKSGRLYQLEWQERRKFLQRITAVCHWNKYDIEILESLYKVKLNSKYFVYKSGLNEIKPLKKVEKSVCYIWLGNSDTETNNHLDALLELSFLKNENVKIICPLNYGNKRYAAHVSSLGKDIFGDKFFPIMEFMQRDEYYKLMDSVDLAYMPHNRGQAGGNIIAFLKKGIKVYMKEQSSIFQLFSSYGIKIFTSKQLMLSTFDELKTPLTEDEVASNIHILDETISNETKRLKALKDILTLE